MSQLIFSPLCFISKNRGAVIFFLLVLKYPDMFFYLLHYIATAWLVAFFV